MSKTLRTLGTLRILRTLRALRTLGTLRTLRIRWVASGLRCSGVLPHAVQLVSVAAVLSQVFVSSLALSTQLPS